MSNYFDDLFYKYFTKEELNELSKMKDTDLTDIDKKFLDTVHEILRLDYQKLAKVKENYAQMYVDKINEKKSKIVKKAFEMIREEEKYQQEFSMMKKSNRY